MLVIASIALPAVFLTACAAPKSAAKANSSQETITSQTTAGQTTAGQTTTAVMPAPAQPQGGQLVILSEKEAADVCYVQPTEELKKKLSPEEYAVLVQAATEPPFQNPYWDNHAAGIYVDRIDNTPLFASSTKFDSGTGWPSFWQPIDQNALVLVEDRSYGMNRIEVRAKKSGGHLGHLFNDGPNPTGLRYCINSASLRFIPKEKMAEEGFASLLPLVESK
ncbi:MAG: peptide-methionine (R)-S-oxide reductase MsrB [Spirochaetia bacterium]|nr:peptide-methionine (R)-S-oxide reductase MsrB [Spirochaetia bacterium]